MLERDRPVEINISGIPVAGVGGLGLVAMAVLVSVVMPAARWAMGAGLIGGMALAVILVIARRHLKAKGPSGTDPKILFRAVSEQGADSNDSRPDSPVARLRDSPIYSTR